MQTISNQFPKDIFDFINIIIYPKPQERVLQLSTVPDITCPKSFKFIKLFSNCDASTEIKKIRSLLVSKGYLLWSFCEEKGLMKEVPEISLITPQNVMQIIKANRLVVYGSLAVPVKEKYTYEKAVTSVKSCHKWTELPAEEQEMLLKKIAKIFENNLELLVNYHCVVAYKV
jgi:hypothetical protein